MAGFSREARNFGVGSFPSLTDCTAPNKPPARKGVRIPQPPKPTTPFLPRTGQATAKPCQLARLAVWPFWLRSFWLCGTDAAR